MIESDYLNMISTTYNSPPTYTLALQDVETLLYATLSIVYRCCGRSRPRVWTLNLLRHCQG